MLFGDYVPADEVGIKESDFKNRARISIDRLAPGSNNSDIRSAGKRVSDGAWTFSCHVTHSHNATRQDAVVCITMTAAVVSMFEQLLDKVELSERTPACPSCKSRQIDMIDRQIAGDKPKETILSCSYCGWSEIIEVNRSAPDPAIKGDDE